MNPRPHWDRIYATKAADEVSWFQREPALSLELIERVAGPDAAVVDVGGGASTLVDRLLDRGFGNVTVLDVSEAALQVSRARLGARAAQVRWVADDVRTHPFAPNSIDVWHDRAVFHFLTAEDDRRRYVEQVARGVRSGGHVIVATFAEDGPTTCSGLEVRRYSPDELHAEFGARFVLEDHRDEDHVTPMGSHQHFRYCRCTLRRTTL
jgi:ubiquinone/menaquinone biosynthesis C-methylase UbiE